MVNALNHGRSLSIFIAYFQFVPPAILLIFKQEKNTGLQPAACLLQEFVEHHQA
jgi:hypothetical protein